MLDITMILKVRYSDENKHQEDKFIRWLCMATLCNIGGQNVWRYNTSIHTYIDLKYKTTMEDDLKNHLIGNMKKYYVVNCPKNMFKSTAGWGDFEFEESDLTESTPFTEYVDNHGHLKYYMLES